MFDASARFYQVPAAANKRTDSIYQPRARAPSTRCRPPCLRAFRLISHASVLGFAVCVELWQKHVLFSSGKQLAEVMETFHHLRMMGCTFASLARGFSLLIGCALIESVCQTSKTAGGLVLRVDEPKRILLRATLHSKELVEDVRGIVNVHAPIPELAHANSAPCRLRLHKLKVLENPRGALQKRVNFKTCLRLRRADLNNVNWSTGVRVHISGLIHSAVEHGVDALESK